MSTLLKYAYHESGHALVAAAMGRPLEVVAISPDGGLTKTSEPLTGDRSPEELEKALTIILAGQAAERYAPARPMGPSAEKAAMNGGPDPYAGLAATTAHKATEGPTDAEVIDVYQERLGDDVVERARRLAVELVDRKHATGALERVADRLYLAGALTADDVERLGAAAA